MLPVSVLLPFCYANYDDGQRKDPYYPVPDSVYGVDFMLLLHYVIFSTNKKHVVFPT